MKMKIQSMQSLKKEMQSVARGDRKTSDDAAQPSFESVESVEAVIRLLTPENRHLLATIEQKKLNLSLTWRDWSCAQNRT